MKKILFYWFILLLASGCKGDVRQRAKGELPVATAINTGQRGVALTIAGSKNCHYPQNDPLFEKKKNKKLVLLQVRLHCGGNCSREDIIPAGALLTDTRGNEYEASPAVIAMAQTSRCITDEDIRDYNAIWNGDTDAGRTYTAWVLGFELPAEAVPERLYWNTGWKNNNSYFNFSTAIESINH